MNNMKLNIMLDYLLDLAKEENEPNRFAHSEEYNELYNELDRKTLIIDEIENQLGCPLEVVFKALRDGIFISDEDFLPHSCLLRNDFILVLFDDIYKAEYLLKDYKKTWWLKDDRSE